MTPEPKPNTAVKPHGTASNRTEQSVILVDIKNERVGSFSITRLLPKALGRNYSKEIEEYHRAWQ